MTELLDLRLLHHAEEELTIHQKRNLVYKLSSSKKESISSPVTTSPTRRNFRNLSEDEPVSRTPQEVDSTIGELDSSIRSKPKANKVQSKNSTEEIHSPVVKNIAMARPAKT